MCFVFIGSFPEDGRPGEGGILFVSDFPGFNLCVLSPWHPLGMQISSLEA